MTAPDFLTIGSVRLVSVRAVSKELCGTIGGTRQLLGEMGVVVRELGDSKTPYVGMWVLEQAVHRWMGGAPEDLQTASSHYAELTRVSMRARLREIIRASKSTSRRTNPPRARTKKREACTAPQDDPL